MSEVIVFDLEIESWKKEDGTFRAEIEKNHAKGKVEKYRIVWERLFESDFVRSGIEYQRRAFMDTYDFIEMARDVTVCNVPAFQIH